MFTLSSSLQYMAFSKPDDVGSAGNGKIVRCLMKYAVVPITKSNNRSPTTTPITAKTTRGFAEKRNIKKTHDYRTVANYRKCTIQSYRYVLFLTITNNEGISNTSLIGVIIIKNVQVLFMKLLYISLF